MTNRTGMTRRGFTKNALYLSGAAIGSPWILSKTARAQAKLAEGKIGGPVGFDGAQSYQYGVDTPEGRAMEALRKMVGDGKAPSTIKLALSEGSIGQLTAPFPKGSPSIKDLFESESGIKLDIIGMPEAQGFTKAVQDISTSAGNYDIYSIEYNRLGDLVETGGVVKLDDYVEKHQPGWDSPSGYIGGKQGVDLLNKYRGSAYAVSLDGDFQTWIYRTDLFEDASHKAAFKEKHGYDLAPPRTFKELDEIATYFHNPEKGLFGCTDLRNQGWGYTNWYQRYVSTGVPNRFLFGNDGKPMVNSAEGIMATKEYVDTLSYHSPDAISWSWPEQYGNMASGGAAMTCAFSNMPKFLDNAGNDGSKVTGKMGSFSPPGRIHGDKLISRSVLWFSLAASVSKQSKHPEACYLFLQWLGGPQVSAWMVANPAGYFDPWQNGHLDDKLVQSTYHEYHVKTIRETIARAVPTINYPGATAFHNALDENLVAALTGGKTPEQAMADTERSWARITRRIGEEKLIEAIKFNNAAWPTIIDPVG